MGSTYTHNKSISLLLFYTRPHKDLRVIQLILERCSHKIIHICPYLITQITKNRSITDLEVTTS